MVTWPSKPVQLTTACPRCDFVFRHHDPIIARQIERGYLKIGAHSTDACSYCRGVVGTPIPRYNVGHTEALTDEQAMAIARLFHASRA